MKKLTKKDFIERAVKTHQYKYDYSNVVYINRRTKVEIICKEHGSFFQFSESHILGAGCPDCDIYTTNDFIKASNKIHNNKYLYNNVVYKTQKHKVEITCVVHGNFLQYPTNHLRGNSCPDCVIAGFNKKEKAIVYYLKIYHQDKTYYKIGITNRDITKRFSTKEMKKIEVIKIWNFEYGEDAMNFEREILNKYSIFRCNNLNILTTGNTELFSKNVLQLD